MPRRCNSRESKGTGYDALTDTERSTVDRLIENPEDESLRQAVYAMMLADARKAAAKSRARDVGGG